MPRQVAHASPRTSGRLYGWWRGLAGTAVTTVTWDRRDVENSHMRAAHQPMQAATRSADGRSGPYFARDKTSPSTIRPHEGECSRRTEESVGGNECGTTGKIGG